MSRVSRVFHRNPGADYPIAVAGEGCWIVDRDGKRYLDAASGAAVSCLGHSEARVADAIKAQVDRLAWVVDSFFTNEPAEELAEMLIADAPTGLGRVWFTSGGSEAIESALKLARQYYVETGRPERRHVIGRRMSYHGNTLGALGVGFNPGRRALYQPLLADNSSHIDPCYAYRGRRDDESEEAFGLRVAEQLEAEIQRIGPENVMAFIAEPVVGATLGCVPAVKGYFQRVRAICDRHDVLLLLDEVMCGMGRTGTLHACEQDGVAPDLMIVAKGLGAGYQPIGAVLIADKIARAVMDGSGGFVHGHTYQAHPVACAGAIAVQNVMRADGLVARAAAMGAKLRARLESRFGNHPHVGDIRGRGLFQGIELVQDRLTKEPFDPDHKLHLKIKYDALARGLAVYPMGGTVDGRRGDHVVVSPPYIIGDDEIDILVDRLAQAIDASLPRV
jgi:adenosylmethionine-8-amino-7-oxononanoate aminotransferase